MPRIRRTAYAFFYCHDTGFLDIGLLLRGSAKVTTLPQILAIAILKGEEYAISPGDLELFLAVPSDEWIEAPAEHRPRISELARKGLLLSDEPDELMLELRRRDELLSSGQWHVYAALYHFMTRWRDVDLERLPDRGEPEAQALLGDVADEFVRRYGTPPPHFHAVAEPTHVLPLPVLRRRAKAYELLRRRKTSRAFDRTRPITKDELSVLLYYTFGCQGIAALREDVVLLRKTSPSGGSMHPTEAYPLIRDVEGIEPGLYHYNAADHALERLSGLNEDEAGELAVELTSGQSYARDAHALVVLTARFYRSFWKYRKHDRAYAVLLMDAAHLSQTFYLLCADLGLGAFVTAAINGANAEERLGLDGFNEGAIAVCGCGRPARASPELEPVFLPYVPRETRL